MYYYSFLSLLDLKKTNIYYTKIIENILKHLKI